MRFIKLILLFSFFVACGEANVASNAETDDENVLQFTATLSINATDDNERFFLKRLKEIPQEARDDVAKTALPLLNLVPDYIQRCNILCAVYYTPAIFREGVIELTEHICKAIGITNGEMHVTVLNALQQTLKEKFECFEHPTIYDSGSSDPNEFKNKLSSMKATAPFLFHKGINLNQVNEITAIALNARSAREIESLAYSVSPLFEKAPPHAYTGILKAVQKIPEAERENVAKNASILINKSMDSSKCIKIVEAIQSISAEDREDVTRHALSFIDAHGAMSTPFQYTCLLTMIFNTPKEKRQDEIDIATSLLNKKDKAASYILEVISIIPAKEREDVIRIARDLFSVRSMRGDEYGSYEYGAILLGIHKTDHTKRAAVAKALQDKLESATMDCREIVDFFKVHGKK